MSEPTQQEIERAVAWAELLLAPLHAHPEDRNIASVLLALLAEREHQQAFCSECIAPIKLGSTHRCVAAEDKARASGGRARLLEAATLLRSLEDKLSNTPEWWQVYHNAQNAARAALRGEHD